jgi:fructan beta-fructosidase
MASGSGTLSGTFYLIGSFDGRAFVPWDAGVRTVDHGGDFYAVQSWADLPPSQNRAVWTAWASDWRFARVAPTDPWRGSLAIPREVRLVETISGDVQVAQNPVRELADLRADETTATRCLADRESAYEVRVNTESSGSIILVFGRAGSIVVSWDDAVVTMDRTALDVGSLSAHPTPLARIRRPSPLAAPRGCAIQLLVDHSVLELFAFNGLRAATFAIYPADALTEIVVDAQMTGVHAERSVARLRRAVGSQRGSEANRTQDLQEGR